MRRPVPEGRQHALVHGRRIKTLGHNCSNKTPFFISYDTLVPGARRVGRHHQRVPRLLCRRRQAFETYMQGVGGGEGSRIREFKCEQHVFCIEIMYEEEAPSPPRIVVVPKGKKKTRSDVVTAYWLQSVLQASSGRYRRQPARPSATIQQMQLPSAATAKRYT